MIIEDYSMVNPGTAEEDCEVKRVLIRKKDLVGAIVKKISKDDIVIELAGFRKGDHIHIFPGTDGFSYATYEGGKA